MNLKKLAEPFKVEDLEFRISRSGVGNNGVWAVALTYITARAIHDRLDEVCGPDKWQMRYKEHLGGSVCEIGIKVGEEWVWKAGGSESTQIEAFKGGLSGAEKRAGVPWGIGRYLYKLSRYDDLYVTTSDKKKKDWNYQGANRTKKIPVFYWENPSLPDEFLPKPDLSTEEQRILLEKLCDVEGMSTDEKISIVAYYCNVKKILIDGLGEMAEAEILNFIDKFETIHKSWSDKFNEKGE